MTGRHGVADVYGRLQMICQALTFLVVAQSSLKSTSFHLFWNLAVLNTHGSAFRSVCFHLRRLFLAPQKFPYTIFNHHGHTLTFNQKISPA
jgi:hypothetical protein